MQYVAGTFRSILPSTCYAACRRMTHDISNNDLFFLQKIHCLDLPNSYKLRGRRNISTLKRNEQQQQIGSYTGVVCIGALRNDQ